MSGKTESDALVNAQETIIKALKEYKPTASAVKGAEDAAKFIDEWIEQENEKNHVFSTELEINDYPMIARSKVTIKVF